jgi:opacity protein-like surface antigen
MSHKSAIASAIGRRTLALALAVGPAVSMPALADTTVYGGGGLGEFRADIDVESFRALGATGVEPNRNSLAFRVFAGYNVSRSLSVEMGWNKLEDSKAIVTGGPAPGNYKFDNRGFDLSVVGTMELNKYFALFGRFGLYSWDADVRHTTTGTSVSESGTDILYGGGLRFQLIENIGFRAEYSVYDVDVVEAGAGKFGLWLISGVLSF